MPKWLDNAIFYEIYPQTFLDTNGDGIGDFQGIIRKLDYIKELGCNAIWLNPCFVSPFSDAGYDVADYYTAAPRYGTNEDLKELFAKAHEKGMHVILIWFRATSSITSAPTSCMSGSKISTFRVTPAAKSIKSCTRC